MRGYNESAATGLTATGSALADALKLNARTNVVATAAASTGVALPAGAAAGDLVFVTNNGANALSVYPATATGTINGGSAGAAVSLAVTTYKTKNSLFLCTGTDTWIQFVGA
jgi:hypothetical protein